MLGRMSKGNKIAYCNVLVEVEIWRGIDMWSFIWDLETRDKFLYGRLYINNVVNRRKISEGWKYKL